MILSTMTPEEKHTQMVRLKPYVYALAKRASDRVFSSLKRAGRYPAFVFLKDKEINGMGKWTVVICAESKADACKGRYMTLAYQRFHVFHSRNPLNNGVGFFLFHPQVGDRIWCCEFPPHYINRVRERLIEPKGIVQPDFDGIVKEILRMHHHAMHAINEGTVIEKGDDGMYDIVKNPDRQRQQGYDNFAAYHRDGISLGVSYEEKYFHYTTFVSNDLLRCSQQDYQRQNLRDAANHELTIRYDPDKPFMRQTLVEKADF